MTTPPTPTKSLRCRTDGRVNAALQRIAHKVPVDGVDIVVDDVAAWVCPACGSTLAIPHEAAGRIASALQRQSATQIREVRVPLELEDMALGINAQLGMAGRGDPFALPVHLGLHLVGDAQTPLPAWRRFDDRPKTVRARPRVHPDTLARLEGLASLWNADVSDVVRWLTVVADQGLLAGLMPKPLDGFDIEVFSDDTVVKTLQLVHAIGDADGESQGPLVARYHPSAA